MRFCLPREPHGLSFLAVYGSDQIRFLSSSQAGKFGGFFLKKRRNKTLIFSFPHPPILHPAICGLA